MPPTEFRQKNIRPTYFLNPLVVLAMALEHFSSPGPGGGLDNQILALARKQGLTSAPAPPGKENNTGFKGDLPPFEMPLCPNPFVDFSLSETPKAP